MVLELGPLQQMEFDEARHLVQMRVARQPDLLEGGLGAFGDAEAVHGDVHAGGLLMFSAIMSSFRDAPQGAGAE